MTKAAWDQPERDGRGGEQRGGGDEQRDREPVGVVGGAAAAAWAVTIEPSTATPSVAPTWRPALWIAEAMPVRVAATAATAVAVVAGSAIPAPAPSASSAGHRPSIRRRAG